MKGRTILTLSLLGLLAAGTVAWMNTVAFAASCKWGNIAIGCNGDCVQLAFSHPSTNCPGSTVDVQRRDCGGGSWVTIATNVTSPVDVDCGAGTPGEYRLVAHCTCTGLDVYSQSSGCNPCP